MQYQTNKLPQHPAEVALNQHLDMEFLNSIKELDNQDCGLLHQLIDYFETCAPERIGIISSALKENNSNLAKKEAHALKSTCHNLGARNLAELCRKIEYEIGSAEELIKQFQEAFPSVLNDLKIFAAVKH